jgi:hypothetical protein
MNKFRSSLCLLGLAVPICTLNASQLESYLPEDCMLVLSLSDYSELSRKSEDSPVNELLTDKKIGDVLHPLTEFVLGKLHEDSEKPLLSWEEIKPHLYGQIVVGMDISTMLAEINASGDTKSKPGLIALANMKDADDFVDLLADRLEGQESDNNSIGTLASNEKFQGVTIRHFVMKDTAEANTAGSEDGASESDDNTRDFFFGNISDTFFVTLDTTSAHDVISAVKGDETGTLGGSGHLAGILSQTEDTDAYIYLDAKPLASLMEAALKDSLAPKEGEAPNPLKPTPEAVISALGMNSLRDVVASVKFESDNVHVCTNIGVDTTFGIGRLFNAYATNYATPDFIPENATAVNASGFNLGTLITEVKQIVFTAAPSFSMIYQAQVAQVQQQTGIDIEKDIIGNLDDGLVAFTIGDPDEIKTDIEKRQQVFALKLKDSATFKRGLDVMLGMTPLAPKMERRDFSGTEITIFNDANSAPTFAMGIKDNWLLMSNSPTSIQSAISADTGKSFWQSKIYDNLGDGKLPAGGIGVSYNDVDALVKTVLYAVAKVYNQSEAVLSGQAKPIDTNLIGEIKNMPFSVCGKAYKTKEGISSSSYLLKK